VTVIAQGDQAAPEGPKPASIRISDGISSECKDQCSPIFFPVGQRGGRLFPERQPPV